MIAVSPQTIQAAMQIGKALGGAIKARRTARIAAGKRVAGQRVRNALLGMGVDLPIPRPRRAPRITSVRVMRQRGGNTARAVPVAFAAQTSSTNAASTTVKRIDAAITVNGWPTVAGKSDRVHVYPVYSSNPQLSPSAELTSDLYSFYRFQQIVINWRPQVSTSTMGEVAICVCPTIQAAASVTDVASCVATRYQTRFSCYSPEVRPFAVSPGMMNMQYYKQGWTIKNNSEIDVQSPQHVQGYIVVATQGGANANETWGSLNISYRCELLQPKPPEPATHTAVISHTEAAPTAYATFMDAAVASNADNYPNPEFLLEADGGNYQITCNGSRPYLVTLLVAGDTTAGGLPAFDTPVGATMTIVADAQNTGEALALGYHSFIVVPQNQFHSLPILSFGGPGSVSKLIITFTRLRRTDVDKIEYNVIA